MQVFFEFTVLRVDDAALGEQIAAAMERDPSAARAAVRLLRDDERVEFLASPTVLAREGVLWTVGTSPGAVPADEVPGLTFALEGSATVQGPDDLAVDLHLQLTDGDQVAVDQRVELVLADHGFARLPMEGVLVWVRPSLLSSENRQRILGEANAAWDDLVGDAAERGPRARRRLAEELLDAAGSGPEHQVEPPR